MQRKPYRASVNTGINQGHADTVQGIGRTVPVHTVTEMEERIEGEVMEERNISSMLELQELMQNQSVGQRNRQINRYDHKDEEEV